MAKDIKALKTDDIVKEITKLFPINDLYVKDDGDKFIINLNKIRHKLINAENNKIVLIRYSVSGG